MLLKSSSSCHWVFSVFKGVGVWVHTSLHWRDFDLSWIGCWKKRRLPPLDTERYEVNRGQMISKKTLWWVDWVLRKVGEGKKESRVHHGPKSTLLMFPWTLFGGLYGEKTVVNPGTTVVFVRIRVSRSGPLALRDTSEESLKLRGTKNQTLSLKWVDWTEVWTVPTLTSRQNFEIPPSKRTIRDL